jgi:glycosyltransferase involved in cell wall biosynthesis
MKEIVFIRRSFTEFGGIENQIIGLAKQLFSRGQFKPVLVTTEPGWALARAFAECGFEVLTIPMDKTTIIRAAKEILRMLEGRDVAIIQTHLFRESLIARAVRRKRKDIRHILRAQTYIDWSINPKWKKKLYHLLDRTTNQWVDCYIANGKYLAEEIIKHSGVNPKKVHVVLNSRDQMNPPDEPCDRPNEPLSPRIALVANLMPGKGHDCLIEALALLKKKKLIITARFIGGQNTGIVSAGRSPDSILIIKKLACQFGVLDQLEFYGFTKDIYAALVGIPVVVLPSDKEGVPNCIIEAMSLRKLVIASDTGGVSEIIDDKKTGLLCKTKDPKGLAELLQYVFTRRAEDFEQMRTAAFERWQKEFTGGKMVDKFIEIYRKSGALKDETA